MPTDPGGARRGCGVRAMMGGGTRGAALSLSRTGVSKRFSPCTSPKVKLVRLSLSIVVHSDAVQISAAD